MISSRAKTTVKGQKIVDLFLKAVKEMEACYVTIGIHSDAGKYTGGKSNPDVVQVALWNEFGTETSPERSFIRSTVDENAALINSWRVEMIENVCFKGWKVDKALSAVGFRIREMIRNKIRSNVPPAYGSGKHPTPEKITRAQAAKSARGVAPVTLIETGLMLRSVEFKVVIK